jgi:hypothetical protein
MKGNADDRSPRKKQKVVRLDDLAPRQDVSGGAGKLVFGEGVAGNQDASGRTPRAGRSHPRAPKARD